MAARAAVVDILGTDPQLNMLGFEADAISSSNATDTPSRDKPFVVVHWDDMPLSGGRPVHMVSIWFHVPKDHEQDYGRIDMAIIRTTEIMTSAEHVEGDDGWSLTSASFTGASPDLLDDGYNSLTRYAQFRCACRNLG